MKKIWIFLMLLLIAPFIVIGATYTIIADTDYNEELPFCYNNNTVQLEGTTANITCRDHSWNTDINNVAATNIATGEFNYTFNLNEGMYSCKLNCITATSADRFFTIEVRPDYLAAGDTLATVTDVTNNVTCPANSEIQAILDDTGTSGVIVVTNNDKTGYNLTDNKIGKLDELDEDNTAIDLDGSTVGTVTTATACTDVTNNVTCPANSETIDILSYVDTEIAEIIAALDGNLTEELAFGSDITRLETGLKQNESTYFIPTLADTSELQADDYPTTLAEILSAFDGNETAYWIPTLADTNELQTDDYPTTFTNLQSILELAISGNASELCSLNNATTLVNNQNTIITNQNTIAGYTDGDGSDGIDADITAIDDYIDTEMAEVLAAITNNATNWFTSTYQSRIDAAISSRSSHSADDVWDQTIGNSSKDVNITIGDMWYIVLTAQNGETANWSDTSSSASISTADKTEIITGVTENVTQRNISAKCAANGTTTPDTLEQQINCLYRSGW